MAHLSAVSASAVSLEMPIRQVGNAELWWIRPHTFALLVLLPLFLSLPLLPSPPRDVKTYFGTELYLLGIGLLVLFGIGSWFGARCCKPPRPGHSRYEIKFQIFLELQASLRLAFRSSSATSWRLVIAGRHWAPDFIFTSPSYLHLR